MLKRQKITTPIEFLDTIYECAVDQTMWQTVLDRLVDSTASSSGVLHLSDSRGFTYQLINGLDEIFLEDSQTYYEHNVWMQRRHMVGPGRAALGETLISLQDLRRTVFYADFLRPYDTVHLCGIALHSGDDQFGAMSLLRPERSEPHGDPELALANAVAPHMRRAARIAGLLEGASPIAPDFEALAEKLSFGLLLLGAKAELLYANPRAEALLRKGPLKVLTGRIMVAGPEDGEMLSRLIDQALKARQALAMILDGPNTSRAQLVAVPLPKRSRDFAVPARRAEVAVLLLEAVGENGIPRETIGKLYGLTPAELRLAEALLAGISPADFGDKIGVSRNTVKTQLRTLYGKVGVSSHAGLVRHLACLTSLRP